MTLTNKDKMMLVILAVVIFVAVFYMYGIVPANDQLDAIKEEVVEKKEAVDLLNARLAAINTASIDKKYDELLDFYYSNNNIVLDQPSEDEEKIIYDVNRKMIELFKRHNFTNYSTSGWKVVNTYQNVEYDGINASYAVKYVDCNTSYRTENIDNIYSFLDEIETNMSMFISNINVVYNVETTTTENPEDPENPIETKIEYFNGNFTIRYMMQVKVNTDTLPKLLGDVEGVSNDGMTIKFNAVEKDIDGNVINGTVKYELYTVKFDDSGKAYFDLIPNSTLTPSTNSGQLSITLKAGQLEAGQHNIFVRAVGDKKQGYFKSELKDNVSYVTITIV